MTFKTHLDEAAFRKEISRWSKSGKTPDYPTRAICCRDELIGGVDGNRFWLKKIRPQFGNTPQRVFYGKIVDRNDYVVVRGKFLFVPILRYSFLILFSILLCIYIFLKSAQTSDFIDVCKGSFLLLCIFAFFAVFFNMASILFHIREEIFVIKYLKSL